MANVSLIATAPTIVAALDERRSNRRTLMVAVGLVLAIWASHLAGIDAFPPFIDETIHVRTAENIIQNQSPLEDAVLGRVFTGWWLIPFQPVASNPIWVARAAVVLAFLPGLAGLMAVARLEAGWRGLLLFGLLYAFSAYHFFYMRLALADPVASSAVALAVWFAHRLKYSSRLTDAALVGMMLFAAFGAKISMLPYFGIPVAAALTLRAPGQSRAANARWMAVALGVGMGLSASFVLLLRLRGLDYLTNALSLAASGRGAVDLGRILSPDRIAANARFTIESLAVYTGRLALVLMVAAVALLMVRRQWFLPLVLLAPVLVIWLNNEQQLRYFPIPMALLLLCAGIAAAKLARRPGVAGMAAALAVIGLWAVGQGIPFAVTAATNSIDLPLPPADRDQYMRSDASGSGLAEVLAFLEEQQAERVIGILANCQGLRYLAPVAVRPIIVCPLIRPDGQDIPALTALAQASRMPGTFVVLETSPYLPSTIPGRLVETIAVGRPPLAIYDLAP